MALPVGTIAPDFTLKTTGPSGLVDVTLSESIGNSGTLLLFFPAAFSSVCTTELCDFSSGLEKYSGLGVTVFGISCDTAFAQAAWVKQYGITVTLLSDYAHKVTQMYDVVLPDLAGLGPSAKRAAILIDAKGIMRYVEETPVPSQLPDFDAVLEAIHTLST